MRKTEINRFRDFGDFNVIQYGHEDCRANYSIGDFVRSNYLIHYVHRGKGTYTAYGKTYNLSAGDAFLIYPNDVTRYNADAEDPWEYSWVEFNGSFAARYLTSTAFSKESPVCFGCVEAENAFFRLVEAEPSRPLGLYSALLEVLDAFSAGQLQSVSMADEYVKYAVNYIHTIHYHNRLSVNEISEYVGINRSYLCRLFKEKLGVSPKQYITSFKLKTASRLLEETNLTIGQVALSSGFDDQLYFSSAFSKAYGCSPSRYRRERR